MSYASKFLSMVRMNNNESVEEMAKKFQISVEDLKNFEESELSIPKDWFQIIYDNYDLSPEDIMIMNDLMDNSDDIKRVEKSHTYKGYTVHIYGMRSMSIRDADGKEVFHTGFRTVIDPTIEEMEQAVEDYFKFTELLQKTL